MVSAYLVVLLYFGVAEVMSHVLEPMPEPKYKVEEPEHKE